MKTTTKRKRIVVKTATLEASTNSFKKILTKRFVMGVRYVDSVVPRVLSMEIIGDKPQKY